MKKIIAFIAAVSIVLMTSAAGNNVPTALIDRLAGLGDYAAAASYSILLPSADEPIEYKINMASSANEADTLAPADYLLEWALDKTGKQSEGFTAYFDGNHYRYRDQLLREYHYGDDPAAFAPGNNAALGVQNQAQFCNLLPQYMAHTLSEIAADSTYNFTIHADTIIGTARVIAIDGTRSYHGTVAQEFIYIFDLDMLPLKMELTNNPGQLGEQVITAEYDYSDADMPVITSEEDLAARYPDAFGKFRESTFSIETLPGRKLPAFSSPTPTGERYTFTKNSQFVRPTILLIVNSDDNGADRLIAKLRKSIDLMDEKCDLIMAFTNNNADAIESTAGQLRPGEHLLMSARGLARDCGVGVTPVIINCDREGTVIRVDYPQQ